MSRSIAVAPVPSGRVRVPAVVLSALVAGAAGVGLAVLVAGLPATGVPSSAAPLASGPSSASQAWSRVPLDARMAIHRSFGANDPAFHVRGLAARHESQDLAFRFGAAGAVIHAGEHTATMRLAGAPVAPTAARNRVSFRRGAITEWYANGPLGLEQGFTVRGRARRAITLDLALGGTLAPRATGKAIAFVDRGGTPVLRSSGLMATDARGRHLETTLALDGRTATISVDTASAQFPVTVDPLVERASLTASDGATTDQLGAVAIDGDTIAVGSPRSRIGGNQQGAVYVFTKPSTGWASAQQTAKLIASNGGNPAAGNGDSLGASVAIDGDTIAAGAPGANGAGAAFGGALYVWVKPAGGWANAAQNAELEASDALASDQLGTAVSIDGDTVVGAMNGSGNKIGKIYVYTKPAGGWTSGTQTARLTGTGVTADDDLAYSVDISQNTVISGARFVDDGATTDVGAVYVWVKPGSAWSDSQHTTRLMADAPVMNESLGGSVAIDGTTVVAGAPVLIGNGGPRPSGRALVFEQPLGGWTSMAPDEVASLTPSDPVANNNFAVSVGISGTRIVAGASGTPSATYVYDRPGAAWANATEAQKVSAASAGGGQGTSVAVSGSSVVASAPLANSGRGKAVVFDDSTTGTTQTTTTDTQTTTTGTTQTTTTPQVTSFVVPPGQITNTTTAPKSTAYEPTATDIIANLYGVKAGSNVTVNAGQFTFIARCTRPAGQCGGAISFAGGTGGGARAAATKTLAKGTFSIPAGKSKRITVKLTKAGRSLLARRKSIRGVLKITLKLDGGRTASDTRRITLKAAKKKRAKKKG